MIDLTSNQSERIYLQWVLSKVLNQILSDQGPERLSSQLKLRRMSETNSTTDRHLLDHYQELLSEQELR